MVRCLIGQRVGFEPKSAAFQAVAINRGPSGSQPKNCRKILHLHPILIHKGVMLFATTKAYQRSI
jgi:hypothetical protein